MKRFLSMLFVGLLITVMCYADTATGKWEGTIALVYDVTVNMKETNGKVNGIVNTEIGDIPLKDGLITGNDIVFKPFSYNGIAVSYVKGKIEGDKMNVVVGFQSTSFKGTLQRVK